MNKLEIVYIVDISGAIIILFYSNLEVPGVPQFPQKLAKPLHEQEHLVPRGTLDVRVVLLAEEVVPERGDVGECLEYDVAVVVGLDVVEADDTGRVRGSVVGPRELRAAVLLRGLVLEERRVQHVDDILQRLV